MSRIVLAHSWIEKELWAEFSVINIAFRLTVLKNWWKIIQIYTEKDRSQDSPLWYAATSFPWAVIFPAPGASFGRKY